MLIRQLTSKKILLLIGVVLLAIMGSIFSITLGNFMIENEIKFWLIVFLLVAITPQIVKVFIRKFDPFSIDFLFMVAFTLYSVTEPIRVLRGLSNYGVDVVTYTLILEVLALVFFYIGFFYNRFGKKQDGIKLNKSHIKTSWIFILAGILMLLVYFNVVGGFSGLSKTEISIAKSNSSWVTSFAFGFKFISIGLLALFVAKMKIDNTRSTVWKFIFILFIYFSFSMLIGERGEIFMLAFSMLLIYHYRVKKIPTVLFFVVGITGYFVFQTMNYLKGVPVHLLLPTFFEYVNWSWYTELGGEFQSAARNLFVLVEYVPSNYDYFYGSSFLTIITGFIPASIWPNRPSSAVGWFNNTFFQSVRESGGGRGFSLVGEGYLNFGLIGVCILFFVIGLLSGYLYNRIRYSDSDFGIIIYASFIPILIYCIRADVTNLSSQSIKGFVIPLLLIYFMGRRNKPIKKRTKYYRGLRH